MSIRSMGALVVGAVTCLALAPTALAKSPTGDYAVFSQCPRVRGDVQLNEISCLYDTIEGGETKIGGIVVPITNKIVLQGGLITNNETGAQRFVGALNGETLSKSRQKIPAGCLEHRSMRRSNSSHRRVSLQSRRTTL
jgi:hypothetical protein